MNQGNKSPVDESDSFTTTDHSTNFAMAMNLTAQQIEEARHPFEKWKDGPFAHLRNLAIPKPEAGQGFRLAVSGHLFGSLLSAKVYCDSLTGISGSGQEQDPVVVNLVASGALRFKGRHDEAVVGPGQLCIRDTKASWDFLCRPGTRIRVITIPRHVVISRMDSLNVFNHAYTAGEGTPEVRFLVNFLDMIEKNSRDLGRSAFTQNLALNACADIVSGMLSERTEAAHFDHPQMTVNVAKGAIEKNLHKQNLSPAMIAEIVGVSVRTLHRAFGMEDDSIMAFARRRRLERARDELISTGNAAGISKLAARWHYADASHFIRHFKSSYGTTPAAYLKSQQRQQTGMAHRS
ncbi:helix-turn-helix domain-containing protein [Streptomyces sp. NPDC059629]|uniref:helix-turn-helix domain-containing protein n=1 Tax=Streptomyces sp. NPDC059629 TaxID=3346889 RepID=UPI0036C6C2B5